VTSGKSEPSPPGGFGLLVLTHGRLAEELVAALHTIVADAGNVEAVSIGWDDDVEDATRRIEAAIDSLDRGAGVLVLTDMFGGTPTNLALALHEQGRVEIVTGVNMPMLIRFTTLGEVSTLEQAADRLAEQGREAIHVASRLLDAPEKPSS
jgi:PTS system mannose-specific IIA component